MQWMGHLWIPISYGLQNFHMSSYSEIYMNIIQQMVTNTLQLPNSLRAINNRDIFFNDVAKFLNYMGDTHKDHPQLHVLRRSLQMLEFRRIRMNAPINPVPPLLIS